MNHNTKYMNCPTCNVSLVMAERNNIEIDYCPQCRGIWLDRGELDKIIERSAEASPVLNKSITHNRAHEWGTPYKKKKKDSFL